jgi:Uma2 family endonuclease
MVAIEVASRGNTPEELDQKVTEFLEFGAAEVWVIHPRSETMVVYFQDGSVVRVRGKESYFSKALGVTITTDLRTSSTA